MQGLVRHKVEKGVRGIFSGEGIFNEVLYEVDENKACDKEPDLRFVQIGIQQDERNQALDQRVKQLAQEMPDLELVKFFELEDEIRDKVRQDQF